MSDRNNRRRSSSSSNSVRKNNSSSNRKRSSVTSSRQGHKTSGAVRTAGNVKRVSPVKKKVSKPAKAKRKMTAAQERAFRKRAIVVGRMIGPLIVLILIIIGIIAVVNTAVKPKDEDVSAGIAYIKELESHSTDEIEAQIHEIRTNEMREAFDSGKFDVWANFKDICLMGDSRVLGFSSFSLLEDRWVLAIKGATINKIPEQLEQLSALNPSYIVLGYGLNDMYSGLWSDVDTYIADLDTKIAMVQEAVPNGKIFVNSIIPAVEPAINKSERWKEVPQWNEAIKKHCEQNGIGYIDISETVEAHKDLYSPNEGIHMQKAFYEYWAYDILMGVMDDGL